ncbi:MAG TPA: Na/Pi cotransporter family protein [Firmicutes bacterium]|nr:Na/Pi cotransporter family protein [Bacillota bacterium]
MQMMSEALQKSAGDRLRRILEAFTKAPLKGVLVGTVITALIQSSSATTVMVVGLVNAGLMTLKEAVGVIMGANIGTTITAQMVSLKLGAYAMPAIGIGFGFSFLGRTKLQKYFGQLVLGFGILFLGIDLMGDAVSPLKESAVFERFVASVGNNRLLGVVGGAVFTGIIQSSSVTTSLLVTMASQGLITVREALPIVLGANIGTCVTALLASVGTCVAARRAALAHLLFNIIGCTVFLFLMGPLEYISTLTGSNPAHQVANAHTIFNVSTTLLLLPAFNYFVSAVTRLIPGSEGPLEFCPRYLDARLLKTPSLALAQAKKEALRMASLAEENVTLAMGLFFNQKKGDVEKIDSQEKLVDMLEARINEYLAKLAQSKLSEEQTKTLTALIHVVDDLERVSDHAQNISTLGVYKYEERLPFSDEAMKELKEMYDLVLNTLKKSIKAFESNDLGIAATIAGLDDIVDDMEKRLRKGHIKRLNEGRCYPASGVLYLDLINDLERVGDHAVNIANALLGKY